MHIVVGTGGRARHRDTIVEQVAQTAHRNGWTAERVTLEALPTAVSSIERLVVCGGDGLVHKCLPHLVGTDVEMAIVPVGSGNDFARAFGIDHHNGLAIAAVAPDREDAVAVDLIQAGDRYAASVVTGGYSGRVNETANGLRFPPGSAKYTVAALREIGRLGAVATKLTLHGEPGDDPVVIEDDLTMFAVGNTPWFGGGMQICPTAEPTDGWLDVLALGRVSRFTFARWLPRVFRGGHTGHDAVQLGRARSITVETDESLWADGELFVSSPTTLTVVPGALQLMVP